MSFANSLHNALAEQDSSFHRPMASGGPPQMSGAPDPVAPNAGVNASVNTDLQVATSEAAAYLALSKTAPGAQVSVARGRFKVTNAPYARGGKLFVTMSDLGSPTTDRYTLVVPTDAQILPKLVRQGSVQGKTQVVNTASLKSEDLDEMTIDGLTLVEYAGKYGGKGMSVGAKTGGAGRAMMLHMLRAKKEKEEKKEKKGKKGKEYKGKMEGDEVDPLDALRDD